MTPIKPTQFAQNAQGLVAYAALSRAGEAPTLDDAKLATHFGVTVDEVQGARAARVAGAQHELSVANASALGIGATVAAGHGGVRGTGAQALRFAPVATGAASFRDALQQLEAAVGEQVTLTGVLGDVVRGKLEGVYQGMIAVADQNSTGLPRQWPIEAVLAFDVGAGAVQVDVTEASRQMREPCGVGLRRDTQRFGTELRMALGLVGGAGAKNQPTASDARTTLLRLIEESAVHVSVLRNTLLPQIRDWGTETARALEHRLTPLVDELAATIQAAPKLLKDEGALVAAVAEARTEFLAGAVVAVDEVLHLNEVHHVWHASPAGAAFQKALDAHMLRLGQAAENSFREWRDGKTATR